MSNVLGLKSVYTLKYDYPTVIDNYSHLFKGDCINVMYYKLDNLIEK